MAKYTLHVNGFKSTLADALKRLNRHRFSTFDSDNDSFSKKLCISVFLGLVVADCLNTHLNGKYYSGGKMAFDVDSNNILTNSGVHWHSTGFNGVSDSLLFTEMKVGRKL